MTTVKSNLNGLYEHFHNKANVSDWERTSSGKFSAWKRLLEYIPEGSFLDIGCGDGSVTEKILPLVGGKCLGLDISNEASKQAGSRGIKVIMCNIEDRLPLEDSSIDHIFCSDLLEHIIDVDRLLDEIERVLKPGGYCVISTPNLAWLPNRFLLLLGLHPLGVELSYRYEISAFFHSKRKFPAGHIHVFTHHALLELLKLHGFLVESCLGARMIERSTLRRWDFPGWAKIAIVFDSFCALRASWSWEIVVKFRKPMETVLGV